MKSDIERLLADIYIQLENQLEDLGISDRPWFFISYRRTYSEGMRFEFKISGNSANKSVDTEGHNPKAVLEEYLRRVGWTQEQELIALPAPQAVQ